MSFPKGSHDASNDIPGRRSACCRSSAGPRVSNVRRQRRPGRDSEQQMAVYFRCYSCNRVWGEPTPLASKVFRDVLKESSGSHCADRAPLIAFVCLRAGRTPA